VLGGQLDRVGNLRGMTGYHTMALLMQATSQLYGSGQCMAVNQAQDCFAADDKFYRVSFVYDTPFDKFLLLQLLFNNWCFVGDQQQR
jgi:hypothetical protein